MSKYWLNIVSKTKRSQEYKILKGFRKVLSLYFQFSYLYLLSAGNINVYTPSQGKNREKYFLKYSIKVKNAESGGK